MIILAAESCSSLGSVAVFNNNTLLSFSSSSNQRGHSEFLNPAIDESLRKSNLSLKEVDIFSCGKGPGSFTGIRVAANIIKSFSYIYKKPMVVCDSFEMLHQQNQSFGPQVFILNAFKNMVYACFYIDDQRVLESCALTIPALENAISQCFPLNSEVKVFGDGYKVYEADFSAHLKSRMTRGLVCFDYPSAESLGLLALKKANLGQTMEWNMFLPLYIRASEAEENLRVK